MRLEHAEGVPRHTADVRPLRADPRHQHGERGVPPAARNAGNHGAVDRAHSLRTLHVDDGSLTGHGDGLCEGPDFQVHVHRRDERRGQLDALALERAEAWQ